LRSRGPPQPQSGREALARVATRYDKLANNFLATAIIAAAIIYWRN
jgi:hypothetical protein